MTLNPVLNAIENVGGSASIPQISSITAMKREVVRDEMNRLAREGTLDHVGGSIYRIKPEQMAATSKTLRPAHVLEREAAAAKRHEQVAAKQRNGRGKDKRRRKSPVSEKIIASLEALGGSGKASEIARVAMLTNSQVSDGCYKLKADGRLTMPSHGVYTLPNFVAPVAPAPVAEAPAPEVQPEAVEAPEAAVEASPEIVEAPAPDETGQIIDAVIAAVFPDGEISVNPKVLRATARLVEATEKVIKLIRD